MPIKNIIERKKYHTIYSKQWYHDNKEERIKQIEERKKKIRQWIIDYKSNLKCEECGESHPATLDFHHIDSKIKDANISIAVTKGWSIKRIEKEIKKCKVLCSNCHRKKHYYEIV